MTNKTEKNVVWLYLLIIPLILWFGNYLIYKKWLPLDKMLAVLLPIATYFLILRRLLFAMFVNWRKDLIKNLVMMLLLLCAAFPLCYLLIYEVYPKMDIVLYNPNVAFDSIPFVKNLLSSFVSVLFLSLSSVALVIIRKERQQRKEALSKAKLIMEDMRYRLQLRKINPHFVSAIMNTAMGRSIMGKGKDSKDTLIRFNRVMAYVLNQDDQEHPTVRLSTEWEHILDLVAVLRWKYGPDKVWVAVHGAMDNSLLIVSMSMLTLVENAIRYTDFHSDRALQITLSFYGGGFSFVCRNGYDAGQRKSRQNTRFGLQNLRERLALSTLGLQLNVEDRDGDFVAELNNIDNYGKCNIYRSDSG